MRATDRFRDGDRVWHRKRHESGTYRYRDDLDGGLTVVVEFDGGDSARVTEALLVPESERPR